MTPEQQAAFINAQAALAMIELAELTSRPFASNDDYKVLAEKYAYVLGHNALVTFFNGYR